MRLDEVENYTQLKNILEKVNWRKFEEIVGKIFEYNGYEVKISKIVSFENTKRQYDVIAKRNHYIIVDCKNWDNKRRIKHGLRKAVNDQIERVKKLSIETEKYPLIVLSCSSPIERFNKVPIISVYKLNSFLSNFSLAKQNILSI